MAMKYRQRLAREMAANPLVRMAALLLDRFLWTVSRLWSHLRYRALFPSGGDSTLHWTTEVKYPENVRIGHRVSVAPYCCLGALGGIDIGDDVRISRGVVIETAGLDLSSPAPYPHLARPIHIEAGAWIGSNAIILGGVTIGHGAIVGAGTVVTRDVAPRQSIVGAKARLIGQHE